MITKIVKNTSGSVGVWRGQTLQPDQSYEIEGHELTGWQSDLSVIGAIQSGALSVNNGTRDMFQAEAASFFLSPVAVTGKVYLDGQSTPASSTAVGDPGQLMWDANYFYVCVAVDTWKRILLSSF